ncbi:MAG: carboxypeptidase regulatory-like domain-containing protein, partial [Kofleriaceae bacterium]|nr:carboxypeptidase regulatory-like domain-containing protein [Kofleriaceae bacterium]
MPPPAACMSQCDPSPGAANTCPQGYHCAPDGFCDAVCTPTGNECGDGYVCTPDGRCKGEDECTGLECQVVNCAAQGKPDTTLKGTVYAPNGTLPLYGIQVYVPNEALPPFTEGAECGRCADLPGAPIVQTTTDEAGNFTLPGVPAGSDIPLVITSGKWRRQIKISTVAECTDTQVAAADSRLPKNRTEGDIPRIALSTGNADSLECLLRRMGIADEEIGTAGDDRRVHLYDSKDSPGRGVPKFDANFPGGSGNFADSKTFWNDVNKLKAYDMVILSCEGGQYSSANKPQDALNAMKDYADLGGRVFLSHWHNIWISGNYKASPGSIANPNPVIQDWKDIATWTNGQNFSQKTDVIDETSNPKGPSFATWMVNVMGSTVRGQIPVKDARITSTGINTAKAELWTYELDSHAPQNFQFTTPVNAPADQRCGKVVYSDM